MQARLDFLFDIEASRLSPILEAVTETTGAEFLGFSRQEVDGRADTLLCDFNYRTLDGLTGETKLFVKRCVWGGITESVHYHYLASYGVSVPRLYGSLRGTDGPESFSWSRSLPPASTRMTRWSGAAWISALPAFPADVEIEASLRATGVKRRRFRVCENQVMGEYEDRQTP